MYDVIKIAQELQDTAQGISYYGNALRVAKDFSVLSAEDRSVLDKCATRTTGTEERMRLQDIAIKLRLTAETQEDDGYLYFGGEGQKRDPRLPGRVHGLDAGNRGSRVGYA